MIILFGGSDSSSLILLDGRDVYSKSIGASFDRFMVACNKNITWVVCLPNRTKVISPYLMIIMDTEKTGSPTVSTHPICDYVKVNKYLEDPPFDSQSKIVVDSKLTDILKRVRSTPWVSFSEKEEELRDLKFKVFGEDAGTIGNPNVALILEKSTPSSFGRGDQTVFDPDYRHGREITADDLTLDYNQEKIPAFMQYLQDDIRFRLFPDSDGKSFRMKLYKLAVYEKDGHFNWHRDTTHGDDHLATCLIALNTEWKGGQLMLRHNGCTMSVDMHPTTGTNDPKKVLGIGVAAFYTDVEHMVEPVTDGVRLVLQFDIFHKKSSKSPAPASSDSEGDKSSESPFAVEEKLSRMIDGEADDPFNPSFSQIITFSGDEKLLTDLVKLVKKYLSKGGLYEVGFALQHLYRQASIQPQYLKGIDSVLYEKLKESFDVSLHPVLLQYTQLSDEETETSLMKYDMSSRLTGPEKEDSEEEDMHPKKKKSKLSIEFHVPDNSVLVMVNTKEYIEHTGNESQPGESQYFGGGIFLRAKTGNKGKA